MQSVKKPRLRVEPKAPRVVHHTHLHCYKERTSSTDQDSKKDDGSIKTKKVCSVCVISSLNGVFPSHMYVSQMPSFLQRGPIGVELWIALVCTLCCIMQYINLYQSGWWLPSYNEGLNIHMIDWFVLHYVMIMIWRPLIYRVVTHYFNALILYMKDDVIFAPGVRLFFFFFWVSHSVLSAYLIARRYGILMLPFMFLPWIMYIYMYYDNFKMYFDFSILLFPAAFKECPTHNCNQTCEQTRKEVNALREGYNARIKYILINSLTNTYYAIYIPACFSQGHLYYSGFWVGIYMTLVGLFNIVYYICQYISIEYYDACHQAALHFGKWKQIDVKSIDKNTPCYFWTDNIYWYQGVIVKHNGRFYKAATFSVASEPGNRAHEYYYDLFAGDCRLLDYWLLVKISVILIEVAALFVMPNWDHVVSIMILLVFTLYSFYSCVFMYLFCVKTYAFEQKVQRMLFVSEDRDRLPPLSSS